MSAKRTRMLLSLLDLVYVSHEEVESGVIRDNLEFL